MWSWNSETGLQWNILGAVSSRYLPRRRLPCGINRLPFIPPPSFPRIPQLSLSIYISYSNHQNASSERRWSSWYRRPHHGCRCPCRQGCLPRTSSCVRDATGTSSAHSLCPDFSPPLSPRPSLSNSSSLSLNLDGPSLELLNRLPLVTRSSLMSASGRLRNPRFIPVFLVTRVSS